jgi:gluconolactonase
VLRIDPDGAVETVFDSVAGRPLAHPNFPLFGADGTLWLTASGRWFDTDDGVVIRMPPGGTPEVVIDDAPRWTNGLALSPDERTLFVLESTRPSLLAYEIGPHGVGRGRLVTAMPADHFPDGLAVDAEGTLYVACWRPDRVYRIRPGAEPEVFLDDPTALELQGPTNLCFGGKELDRLYIAQFGGRALREISVEVPGPVRGQV